MSSYRKDNASAPSLLISAHCSTIQRKAKTLDIQELSSILDDLVRELNVSTIRLDTYLNSLNKIVRLLNSSLPPKLVQIPSHYFFTMVRNTIRNFLLQLAATKKLDADEVYVLRNCALFIHHFIEHIPDVSKVLHWVVDATFVDSLGNILGRIKKVSKKKQNTQAVKQIARLLNIFCLIQERLPVDLHHGLFVRLLQPTIDCLTSSTYLKLFENLQANADSLAEIEKLYLIKCPYFLTTYAGPSIAEAIEQVLDVMLPRYVLILDKHVKTIKQWKRPMMRAIHNLIITIIYAEGYFGTYTKTDTFRQLIKHLLTILNQPRLTQRIQPNSNNVETLLIDAVLVVFGVLVYESNALDFIKQCKPIEIFRHLLKVSHETIPLNAQMMLAYTINDRDMKTSQDDLVRLLSTTFNLLQKTIDKQQQEVNLNADGQQENIERNIIQLLETLKGLSQYEQIQEEVFKQNITLFLIESYKKLDGLSRQVLLECLWKLSFNEQIARQIREQIEFIQILTNLPKPVQDIAPQNALRRSNSYSSRRNSMSASFVEATNYEIRKVAEGILWKVTKEPQLREKMIKQREISDDGDLSQKFKYDLMISSSTADKNIVENIRQLLVNEGYNVWFDSNQSHGQGGNMNIMETVTETIDNSQFVIICLSDSYKRDSFCQQQAEYALHSKRKLLPIIVNKGYKPDGWLISLISNNAPIDFGSSNFNSASEMLIKEIKQRQQKNQQIDTTKVTSTPSAPSTNISAGQVNISKQQEPVNQLSRNINRQQFQQSNITTPTRPGTASSIASDLSVSTVTEQNQKQRIYSNEHIHPIVNYQQPQIQPLPRSILKVSSPAFPPINPLVNTEMCRQPEQQTVPSATQISERKNVPTISENKEQQESSLSSSSSSSEDEITSINYNAITPNTIHSVVSNANINQYQSPSLYSTPKSLFVDTNTKQQQQQQLHSATKPVTSASILSSNIHTNDNIIEKPPIPQLISSRTNSRATTPATRPNSTLPNNQDKLRLPDQYLKRKTQNSTYRTTSLNSWKSNDILDYLFDSNLVPMMPLCESMSGKALLRLFRMCQRKPSRLYDQLNQELRARFNGYNLPMGIYTQFLIEMDTLTSSIPDALLSQPDPSPKIIERVIYVSHNNFNANKSVQQTSDSSQPSPRLPQTYNLNSESVQGQTVPSFRSMQQISNLFTSPIHVENI